MYKYLENTLKHSLNALCILQLLHLLIFRNFKRSYDDLGAVINYMVKVKVISKGHEFLHERKVLKWHNLE